MNYKKLEEHGSPTSGQIKGNNRQMRYWSPEVRSAVLTSRAFEVEAFARDRRLDPGLLISIAEAVMRLGRMPDLGMYGLNADDSKAVTHFMADVFMNTEDEDDVDIEDQMDEATPAAAVGPYMKFFHGVLERAKKQNINKKFKLPDDPHRHDDKRAPESPYKFPTGVGMTHSPFNTDGVNPAFNLSNVLDGINKASPLEHFRKKIRAFRNSRNQG